MYVSLKMVDGDQRLRKRVRKRLGKADSDQQRAREARPLRDGESVDGVVGLSRVGQRLPHYGHDSAQMLARRELGNDAAIGGVRADLRRDYVRQNLFARAHHGRARLVARAFNPENDRVRHE